MGSRIQDAFFSPPQLERTLVVLCENARQEKDPVTHTLITMVSHPLQLHLTAVGLQPFRGKETTFPYEAMSPDQQQTLRKLLEQSSMWTRHESCQSFLEREFVLLDPGPILHALCRNILTNSIHKDRRVRVAVCNIILQRVQANVPLSKKLQAQLNLDLFESNPESAGGGP
jgi:hypothetical protein